MSPHVTAQDRLPDPPPGSPADALAHVLARERLRRSAAQREPRKTA